MYQFIDVVSQIADFYLELFSRGRSGWTKSKFERLKVDRGSFGKHWASNRKVAKPSFDSRCGCASQCPWRRHL